MKRGIVIQIISLGCIVLFWLRLLRQIQHKLGRNIFLRCTIYAGISVCIIAGLAWLRNSPLILSFSHSLSADQAGSLLPIFSILSIIFVCICLRKKSRLSSLVQSLLVVGIGSLIPSLSHSLANVRSEESLKQSSIQGAGQKSIFSDDTSLFLVGCVSAIVFGGIENILFFIKAFTETNTNLIDYMIQRSLIPLLIHIASLCITIAIGYQLYRGYKRYDTSVNTAPQTLGLGKKISLFLSYSLSLMLASIGGIAFHALYNLSLTYQLWIMIPLLCIASIGMISYGLFRSDLLYTSSTLHSES